jgi:hypothetical protein
MEALNTKQFVDELCRLLKDSKADPDEVDEFVDYFTFKVCVS